MNNHYLKNAIKFFVCFQLGFLSWFSAKAQDTAILKSKLERFYNQPNKLYKTEMRDLGKIGDVKITFMKAKDMASNETLSGVSLIQLKTFLLSPISAGGLIIDMEDLPGIIKTLSFYQEEIKQKSPQNEVIYTYTTGADILVSCSYTKAIGWSVVLGKQYHTNSYSTANPNAFTPMGVLILKNKDVDDIAAALSQAMTTNL